MLLTIERVIILKSVNIFSEVPEEDLVEVASIVEELEVKTGEDIIVKGDIGTAMYIIVKGRARVHDSGKELAVLEERTVFGELAALDPEPRAATITALEDCHLFKLEEAPLYDLMSEHVEVVRGIIRVLCRRMRGMLRQQMIALKAIGDIDGDGKTDERDLVLQQQREESLLEYVRQVFLFKQSSARHSWAERGMGYDEWQRIQDVCIKAGLFTTHLDSAGKRHASKVQMSYPAAVHALKNSGALILTRLPDVIPQTGPSVKDSRNPVASERFDGPITTLPS